MVTRVVFFIASLAPSVSALAASSKDGLWKMLDEYALSIGLPSLGKTPEGPVESVSQSRALNLVYQWCFQHPGQAPVAKDFGTGAGQIAISYPRLTGTDSYRLGGPLQEEAVFPSTQQFWLHFYHYARAKGLEFKLSSARFKGGLSTETRRILQKEVLESATSWMEQHGLQPQQEDFGQAPEQIPYSYPRVTGTDAYSPGAKLEQTAIFPNTQSFWCALKAYARNCGLDVMLMDVAFKGALHELTREILQQEALEMTLTWIQTHGKQPRPEDFSRGLQGKIPISYSRLTGFGLYAPGKDLEGSALFANPQTFWLQLREYAKLFDYRIRLLNIDMRGDLFAVTRSILQQEALEILEAWGRNSDEGLWRLPQTKDFKSHGGPININYYQLVGLKTYGPRHLHGSRIFDSSAAYQEALKHHFKHAKRPPQKVCSELVEG